MEWKKLRSLNGETENIKRIQRNFRIKNTIPERKEKPYHMGLEVACIWQKNHWTWTWSIEITEFEKPREKWYLKNYQSLSGCRRKCFICVIEFEKVKRKIGVGGEKRKELQRTSQIYRIWLLQFLQIHPILSMFIFEDRVKENMM